jgi:hypothetical protein
MPVTSLALTLTNTAPCPLCVLVQQDSQINRHYFLVNLWSMQPTVRNFLGSINMVEIIGLGIGPSSRLFGCLQPGWAPAQSGTTSVNTVQNGHERNVVVVLFAVTDLQLNRQDRDTMATCYVLKPLGGGGGGLNAV